MAEQRPDIVVLNNVRLSFPNLYVPTSMEVDGKKKYNAHGIIDINSAEGKAGWKRLTAVVKSVAEKEWKDKADRVLKSLEKNRKFYRNGDDNVNGDGDVYDGYEGLRYVSVANARRPQTLDRNKRPVAEEDAVFYGGCYVDMVIAVYAMSKKESGGNGIFASLEIVRFRGDGDPFGAAPVDVDEYLDDYDGEDEGTAESDDDDDLV